jgi:hypothetical protein
VRKIEIRSREFRSREIPEDGRFAALSHRSTVKEMQLG